MTTVFSEPAVKTRLAPHLFDFSSQRRLSPYLFLAPYLILFGIFLMLPAIVGVFASFTDWSISGTPHFVGLKNYQTIFNDPLFQQSLVNTLYFVAITAVPLIVVGLLLALLVNQNLRGRTIIRTIIFNDPLFQQSLVNTLYFVAITAVPLIVVGLLLALLVNQNLRGCTIIRTIIFLPYVVSISVVGIVWVWILDRTFGLLNFYLGPLGIHPAVGWLTDVNAAMPALAVTTVWWTVNANMIIYLAGLQDIPEELYEAARIDGANGWQVFRFITIPMLLPVNAFVIPTTVIACWRVFGQAFVMTKGGPQGRTFVIAQYIYQTAFQNFRMGQAAAAAVILLLLTLAFTVVQLRTMKVL